MHIRSPPILPSRPPVQGHACPRPPYRRYLQYLDMCRFANSTERAEISPQSRGSRPSPRKIYQPPLSSCDKFPGKGEMMMESRNHGIKHSRCWSRRCVLPGRYGGTPQEGVSRLRRLSSSLPGDMDRGMEGAATSLLIRSHPVSLAKKIFSIPRANSARARAPPIERQLRHKKLF